MKASDNNHMSTLLNRELSSLEFNERVLEEVKDKTTPLLERLKFAAIVSSNLDEFFMVRVASVWDQIVAGLDKRDASDLTPRELMDKISARTHVMVHDLYNCYNRTLSPSLHQEGIYVTQIKKLNKKQRDFVDKYFWNNIYPILTPMVVDKSRPFPLILSKSLNIALLIKKADDQKSPLFATVQVPGVLERLVSVPADNNGQCLVLLEDIITINLPNLFKGHRILTSACYRITRNADLSLDEEGAEDLLIAIEQSLKKRKWGAVIRLEVEAKMDPRLLVMLNEELEVPEGGIYQIKGPLDLTFLFKLHSLPDFDQLRYPAFFPRPSYNLFKEDNIFQAISHQDILVHHPFESFSAVIELVQCAAADPRVLAIKQTLYRVSGNSPIVETLARAAENGKQVTVLVELKARFDEENNINWARRLETAGCQVIYGLIGLKTHCKALLIVRQEETGIKRYVHLSTGNYNDVTAQTYTDLSLFTCSPLIGADASALFNMLSGYSKLTKMYKMDVAPLTLRKKFISLIKQEAKNARLGKKARIIAKVNSLVDEEIIKYLYEASQAGVKIDLIVRGICCLKPGLPGLSDRITVRSIVGRFLEHSRIFYFYNNGDELIYLSSADLMERNLDRRVEILFPVDDKTIRARIKGILDIYLLDVVKARILNLDGTYSRADKRGKETINSQEYFFTHTMKADEDLIPQERPALESLRQISS